ncbi:Leucine-rich repeat-containing protein 37A3, partial [Ophiophagus hannah]
MTLTLHVIPTSPGNEEEKRSWLSCFPFLSSNLSGNRILRITQGAFQAWHGMQFLYKL